AQLCKELDAVGLQKPLRSQLRNKNNIASFSGAASDWKNWDLRAAFLSSGLQARAPRRSEGFQSASPGVKGPVHQYVEETLLDALKPAHLEVRNESRHNAADETHFHVLVVSEAFEALTMLESHRLVNDLFMNADSSLKFHSLRITSRTPDQWSSDASVPARPACSGH
ncbi:unnamed protein product, partial [Polarella glacialis]